MAQLIMEVAIWQQEHLWLMQLGRQSLVRAAAQSLSAVCQLHLLHLLSDL